jgi:hypothetical protein
MTRMTRLMTTALFVGAVAALGATRPAMADPMVKIPQSERFEHAEIIAKLTALAQRPEPVGPAAQKVLDVVKPHLEHDEDVVLPPLTLLPLIAQGKVSASMKWALPMIDRVKDEQAENTKVHEQITAQLMALFAVADDAHDEEAGRIAREIAGDLLHDDEVTEPTVILLGEYLRAKLAS